jgi:hypothetical protein
MFLKVLCSIKKHFTMAYQTAEQVTALVLNRKNYKLDKYYIKQDFQRQFFTLNLKKHVILCY